LMLLFCVLKSFHNHQYYIIINKLKGVICGCVQIPSTKNNLLCKTNPISKMQNAHNNFPDKNLQEPVYPLPPKNKPNQSAEHPCESRDPLVGNQTNSVDPVAFTFPFAFLLFPFYFPLSYTLHPPISAFTCSLQVPSFQFFKFFHFLPTF
jgi:hypothetical protein